MTKSLTKGGVSQGTRTREGEERERRRRRKLLLLLVASGKGHSKNSRSFNQWNAITKVVKREEKWVGEAVSAQMAGMGWQHLR